MSIIEFLFGPLKEMDGLLLSLNAGPLINCATRCAKLTQESANLKVSSSTDLSVSNRPQKTTPGSHGASEVWQEHDLVREITTQKLMLGRRLRALREALKFTQEKAAERAHLHELHVLRLEKGAINCTLATMTALARAYGVSIRDLFTDGAEVIPSAQTATKVRTSVKKPKR